MNESTKKNCELIYRLWKDNPGIRICYFCQGEAPEPIAHYLLSLHSGVPADNILHPGKLKVRDVLELMDFHLLLYPSMIGLQDIPEKLQKADPVDVVIFNDPEKLKV